jgi:hypothetical protein
MSEILNWTDCPRAGSMVAHSLKRLAHMASNAEVITELSTELSGAEAQSVEAISRDLDVPIIEVARLYKVERSSLEDVATIRSFVSVIASRQVRIKLKQQNH